jgi:hypothetical protein
MRISSAPPSSGQKCAQVDMFPCKGEKNETQVLKEAVGHPLYRRKKNRAVDLPV